MSSRFWIILRLLGVRENTHVFRVWTQTYVHVNHLVINIVIHVFLCCVFSAASLCLMSHTHTHTHIPTKTHTDTGKVAISFGLYHNILNPPSLSQSRLSLGHSSVSQSQSQRLTHIHTHSKL